MDKKLSVSVLLEEDIAKEDSCTEEEELDILEDTLKAGGRNLKAEFEEGNQEHHTEG